MDRMVQSKNLRKCLVAIGFVVPIFCHPDHSIATDPQKSLAGNENVPYVTSQYEKGRQRTIHTNQAVVRSGPSDKHYSTQSLTKGQSVDVYMETSNGWSGIRPPHGSHNWIPAQIAYLLPGGKTAEIVNDNTPAWIGSDSQTVKDLEWSISLKKSQQVQVLGEELLTKADGTKQWWYRIAPPQGEFRWIRTSQLSDQPTPPLSDQPTPPHLSEKVKDTAVQLAGHVQPSENSQMDVADSKGELVWSNESEVLAQLEQQIRAEQSQARQGASSNDESQPSVSTATPLRPIPMPENSSKAKAMAHQTDSFQHWESLKNSDDPKLRVGPMRSVLGLIGLSVVEAERIPPNARIAQSYHSRENQNHLGHVGPVQQNRLDRLPRPGRRVSGSTLPSEEWGEQEGDLNEVYYDSAVRNPMDSANYNSKQPTLLSRWLNGQEPLFNNRSDIPLQQSPSNQYATQHGLANVPSASFASETAIRSGQSHNSTSMGVPSDTSAWHGFPSAAARDSVGVRANARPSQSDQDADQIEEFSTPEIQSALVSLTQEVASPTEQWDFSSLRQHASNWIENGSTAMVRGEARLLMDRIDRFESLRQRTLGLVQNTSQMAQHSAQQAMQQAVQSATLAYTSANTGSGVVPASAVGAPAYSSNSSGSLNNGSGDASGWLVQVHSTIPGQPEYALTDDAGNVIAYVQSTAALNLRRHLQQPVKIYGVRGYLPNLAAKQILAERIQRLR